jgi:hypothetical protein
MSVPVSSVGLQHRGEGGRVIDRDVLGRLARPARPCGRCRGRCRQTLVGVGHAECGRDVAEVSLAVCMRVPFNCAGPDRRCGAILDASSCLAGTVGSGQADDEVQRHVDARPRCRQRRQRRRHRRTTHRDVRRWWRPARRADPATPSVSSQVDARATPRTRTPVSRCPHSSSAGPRCTYPRPGAHNRTSPWPRPRMNVEPFTSDPSRRWTPHRERAAKSMSGCQRSCATYRSAPTSPLIVYRDAASSVRRGPHVAQVVGDVGEEPPIERGVLAHQRRLMTEVERLVAEPGRHFTCAHQLVLFANAIESSSCLEIGEQCGSGGVLMTALQPGFRHCQPIADQRFLISSPHCRCGMVSPPVAGHGQCPQHLDGFGTLLAQPARVEQPRGVGEVATGQEGLHTSDIPALRQLLPSKTARNVAASTRGYVCQSRAGALPVVSLAMGPHDGV